MAALAERWLPPMVHEARAGDPALMTPLKAMVMRASPDQHRRQIRALLDRPDTRPLLPAIACPTLVMVGRQDRWSPLYQHEEIAAALAAGDRTRAADLLGRHWHDGQHLILRWLDGQGADAR